MRRALLVSAVLLVTVNTVFSQCGVPNQWLLPNQRPGLPSGSQQQPLIPDLYKQAAQKACADRKLRPEQCALLSFTIKPLMGNIRLYYTVLQVRNGRPGQFYCIGIARVVSDQRPWLQGPPKDVIPPAPSVAAFFLHGAAQTFASNFIHRSTLPDDPGIAPWLAERGIDVWGVDLPYTFVSSTTRDFSLMAGWGMKAMTNDVLLASRFVRYVRSGSTPSGPGTLHFVGQSLGGALVYSAASREAVLSPDERDIGDVIAIETLYRLDPGDSKAHDEACLQQSWYGAMDHVDNLEQKRIGKEAQADPNKAPAAVSRACSTPFPILRTYHLAACSTRTPTTGRFSPSGLIVDFLANTVPFQPSKLMSDFYKTPCHSNDPTYGDNLRAVSIPSLYIGVAGGFGHSGEYTNSQLGLDAQPEPPDKKTIFVQMLLSGQEKNDFGHVETFIGYSAQTLVWQPILDWIRSHPRN